MHRIPAITFLLLFFALVASGQPENFHAFGTIDDDGDGLAGVKVNVLVNGSKVQSTVTDKKGDFDLKLDYGKDYIVEFSKQGYATKLVSVKAAGVKKDDVSIGQKYDPWEVGMIHKMEGIDYSILEKPVGEITFNKKSGYFEWDAQYTLGVLKQLEKLTAEVEEAKEEERERQEQLQEDYEDAMGDGEKALKKGEYAAAKAAFNKAKGLKPDEPGPDEKLAEANKAEEAAAKQAAEEAAAKKAEEEHARKEEEYETLIGEGDGLVKKEKFDEAIAKYKAAQKLLPGKEDAQALIAEAEKKKAEKLAAEKAAASEKAAELAEQEQKEKEEKFENLVKEGEDLQKEEKFDEAVAKYEEAKTVLPGNANIDGKIAEAEAAKQKKTEELAQQEAEEEAKKQAELEKQQEQEEKEKQEELLAQQQAKEEEEEERRKKEEEEQRKKEEEERKKREAEKAEKENDKPTPAEKDPNTYKPSSSEPPKYDKPKGETGNPPDKPKVTGETGGDVKKKPKFEQPENKPTEKPKPTKPPEKEQSEFEDAHVHKNAKEVKKTSNKHHDDHDDMLAALTQAEKHVEKSSSKPAARASSASSGEFDLFNADFEDPTFYTQLSERYPVGVTQKKKQIGNKVITIRVVVDNEHHGHLYRKVRHSWGGEFYFLNNTSISQFQYEKESHPSNF